MSSNFQTVHTNDEAGNRVQANVTNSMNKDQGPFMGGNLIKGVRLSTTNVTIPHGLGRVPEVFVICDLNALETIKRVSWDKSNAILVATGDCTVTLWFN